MLDIKRANAVMCVGDFAVSPECRVNDPTQAQQGGEHQHTAMIVKSAECNGLYNSQ